MKEPAHEDYFRNSFSTIGLSADEIAALLAKEFRDLREDAAKAAADWLLQHGHFNGDITQDVRYKPECNEFIATVTLTCYGLPLRADS